MAKSSSFGSESWRDLVAGTDPVKVSLHTDPPAARDYTQSPAAPRYGEPGVTSTFIQWKGTDLCMDFICACGEQSHYDGYFAYLLRCPKCGRVFSMPSNPAPIELTALEVAEAVQSDRDIKLLDNSDG